MFFKTHRTLTFVLLNGALKCFFLSIREKLKTVLLLLSEISKSTKLHINLTLYGGILYSFPLMKELRKVTLALCLDLRIFQPKELHIDPTLLSGVLDSVESRVESLILETSD